MWKRMENTSVVYKLEEHILVILNDIVTKGIAERSN